MLRDMNPLSPWSVLHQGISLVPACRKCQSTAIGYYKVYSSRFRGILPICQNCRHEMIVKERAPKSQPLRKILT